MSSSKGAGLASPQLVLAAAQALRQSIEIRDRPGFARGVHVNAFVGSDAVGILAASRYCPTGSRADAVALGRQLLRAGLFHHVNDDHEFADKPLLYRFFVDEDRLYKRFWAPMSSSPRATAADRGSAGASGQAASAAPFTAAPLLLPAAGAPRHAIVCVEPTPAAVSAALERVSAWASRLAAAHDAALWRIQPHVACNSLALGHWRVDKMHGSLHALSVSAKSLVATASEAKKRMQVLSSAAAPVPPSLIEQSIDALNRRLHRQLLQHVRLHRQLLDFLRETRAAVRDAAVDGRGGPLDVTCTGSGAIKVPPRDGSAAVADPSRHSLLQASPGFSSAAATTSAGQSGGSGESAASEWVPAPVRRARDAEVFQRADGTLHPSYKTTTTVPASPHAVLAFLLYPMLRCSWDPALATRKDAQKHTSNLPGAPRPNATEAAAAAGTAACSPVWQSANPGLAEVLQFAEGPFEVELPLARETLASAGGGETLRSAGPSPCAVVGLIDVGAASLTDLLKMLPVAARPGTAGYSGGASGGAPQERVLRAAAGSSLAPEQELSGAQFGRDNLSKPPLIPHAARSKGTTPAAHRSHRKIVSSSAAALIVEASEEDDGTSASDGDKSRGRVSPLRLDEQRGRAGGSEFLGSDEERPDCEKTSAAELAQEPQRRATSFTHGSPGDAPIVEEYFPSPLLSNAPPVYKCTPADAPAPSTRMGASPLVHPMSTLHASLAPPLHAAHKIVAAPPSPLMLGRSSITQQPSGFNSGHHVAAALPSAVPSTSLVSVETPATCGQARSRIGKSDSVGAPVEATPTLSSIVGPASVAISATEHASNHRPPDGVHTSSRNKGSAVVLDPSEVAAEEALFQTLVNDLRGTLPKLPSDDRSYPSVPALATTAMSPLHYIACRLEAALCHELPLRTNESEAGAPHEIPLRQGSAPLLQVPRVLHRRLRPLSALLAPRDAVTLQDVGIAAGTGAAIVVYEVSVQHRFVPPTSQGYVRMSVFLEAYVLEPEAATQGRSTRVTFISQISLRGQLPPWLARTLVDRQTLSPLTALRKAMAAYSAAVASVPFRPSAFPERLMLISRSASREPSGEKEVVELPSRPSHARVDFPRTQPLSDPVHLLQLRSRQMLQPHRREFERRSRIQAESQALLYPEMVPLRGATSAQSSPKPSNATSVRDDGHASAASATAGARGALGPVHEAWEEEDSSSSESSSCSVDSPIEYNGLGRAVLLLRRSSTQRRRKARPVQPSTLAPAASVAAVADATPPLLPATVSIADEATAGPAATAATPLEEEQWWRAAVAELESYAATDAFHGDAGVDSDTVRSLMSGSASIVPDVLDTASQAAVPITSSDLSSSVAPTTIHAGRHIPEAISAPAVTSSEVFGSVGLADFEVLCVLGRGGYGKVLLVKRIWQRQSAGLNENPPPRDVGALYAMKVLRKRNIISRRSVGRAMTERRILSRVRHHPFIVSLRYAFQTPAKLYLVMEWAPGGDLFALMARGGVPAVPSSGSGGSGTVCEEQAVLYLAEVVLALAHLHHAGIVYRDLKPENVLLDAAGHVRLADFGLSRYAGSGREEEDGGADSESSALERQYDISHSFAGTEQYMAPEILLQVGHSAAVDWWSLGILASEIMCGRHPFRAATHHATLQAIVDPGTPPATLKLMPPLAASFVEGLLQKDPSRRLGSVGPGGGLPALLQHPFFRARPGPGLPPEPMDWRRVLARGYGPLYVPFPDCPADVSLFDVAFTRETPADSIASSPTRLDALSPRSAATNTAADFALDGTRPHHGAARDTGAMTAFSAFTYAASSAFGGDMEDGDEAAAGRVTGDGSECSAGAESTGLVHGGRGTWHAITGDADEVNAELDGGVCEKHAAGALVDRGSAAVRAPAAAAVPVSHAATAPPPPVISYDASQPQPPSADGYISEEAEYSLYSGSESSDSSGESDNEDDGDERGPAATTAIGGLPPQLPGTAVDKTRVPGPSPAIASLPWPPTMPIGFSASDQGFAAGHLAPPGVIPQPPPRSEASRPPPAAGGGAYVARGPLGSNVLPGGELPWPPPGGLLQGLAASGAAAAGKRS